MALPISFNQAQPIIDLAHQLSQTAKEGGRFKAVTPGISRDLPGDKTIRGMNAQSGIFAGIKEFFTNLAMGTSHKQNITNLDKAMTRFYNEAIGILKTHSAGVNEGQFKQDLQIINQFLDANTPSPSQEFSEVKQELERLISQSDNRDIQTRNHELNANVMRLLKTAHSAEFDESHLENVQTPQEQKRFTESLRRQIGELMQEENQMSRSQVGAKHIENFKDHQNLRVELLLLTYIHSFPEKEHLSKSEIKEIRQLLGDQFTSINFSTDRDLYTSASEAIRQDSVAIEDYFSRQGEWMQEGDHALDNVRSHLDEIFSKRV
jgi:hypothetical protein